MVRNNRRIADGGAGWSTADADADVADAVVCRFGPDRVQYLISGFVVGSAAAEQLLDQTVLKLLLDLDQLMAVDKANQLFVGQFGVGDQFQIGFDALERELAGLARVLI